MTTAPTDEPTTRNSLGPKPLRVWPGVLAVVLQWLAWMVLPRVVPEAALYGILGGILGGGLAVIVWWLFFSRAPWIDRLVALVLIPVALFATSRLVHPSITGGAMGMLLPILAIPVLCLALVCWAVMTRRLSAGPRRASMVATILLACGIFALLRTGGMSGDGDSDLHWRWTPTPEERLLVANYKRTRGQRTGRAPVHADSSEDRRHVAQLSRIRSRRRRARRPRRHRLVSVSAGPTLATADRTRLVVLRGRR